MKGFKGGSYLITLASPYFKKLTQTIPKIVEQRETK